MQLGSGIAVVMARPAAAALIQPLTWEPPYATEAAKKIAKKTTTTKKKKNQKKKKKSFRTEKS